MPREANMPDNRRTPTAVACHQCGADYVQPRRLASHYCPTCRRERNRQRDRDRKRACRAVALDARNLMSAAVLGEPPQPRVASSAPRADLQGSSIIDRMPAGANTPAGPHEGTTTHRADLARVLDAHAAAAAAHPWWTANRHWHNHLHDSDDATAAAVA